MFRKDLERRLKAIFGWEYVRFTQPSEMFEQDTAFIHINEAKSRMSRLKGGRETARVTGSIVVYTQENRLPFGFFNKRIEQADPDLTRNLFFYDIDADMENSPARIQDIHERRTGFLFLYDAQYDPSRGDLTSVGFSITPD